MRRLAILIFLLLAAPAHAIVGGKVTHRQWPAAAQLHLKTEEGFAYTCGANVVRPDWVLTAAHCVDGVKDPEELKVVTGRATLDGTDGQESPAAKVEVHPRYDGNRNDVALIRLEKATTQPPIRIVGPSQRELWQPGDPATVIGWGAEIYEGPPSNELREVTVPIVEDTDCSTSYWLTGPFDPGSMLCAGELTGRRDSCSGDSGGPLMVADGAGDFVLVGTVSFGTACALPTQYGVYARVGGPAIRSWLDAELPAEGAPQTSEGTGAPSPPPAPAPAPSGGGGAAPPAASPPVEITFARDLGSARLARKRRRIGMRLRTSARVTDVRIRLVGVGSARLAALEGRQRLAVRMSRATARKLRAGQVITVSVIARDEHGRVVRAGGRAKLSR